jgi:hypothetical protein
LLRTGSGQTTDKFQSPKTLKLLLKESRNRTYTVNYSRANYSPRY